MKVHIFFLHQYIQYPNFAASSFISVNLFCRK